MAKKKTSAPEDRPKHLIVEKSNGRLFVYRETEEHFKLAEAEREREKLHQLPADLLDFECDLSSYADNTYFVFKLAES